MSANRKKGEMRMSRLITITLIATGWLLSMEASAAVSLTEWGATARTYSADCTGGLSGDCSSFLTISLEDGESVGGSGDTTTTIGSAIAGSAVGQKGRGTAGAEVVIPASDLSIPTLRARAESTDGDGWAGGSALAVQGYQFTGANGSIISLDASLTGTVNLVGASVVTGLEVNIWVLCNTGLFSFPSDPVPTAELIAGIVVNSLLPGGGIDPFVATLTWDATSTGTGAINQSTAAGGSDPDDQLNFTVDKGEEFYLFAGLSASADGAGASALSWSTLTLDFDTPDLVAASAVRVPAAI